MFKNKKGFTLIEILVVVLIIGILAAIAVPQYQLAIEKSRASEALSAVKALKEAADVYYLSAADGSNPSLSKLDISFSNNLLNNYELKMHSGLPHAYRTIDGKTAYILAFYDSKRSGNYGLFCILPSKASKNYDPTFKYAKLCKSLGGVQADYCYDKCYTDSEYCKNICFKLQ